MNSSEGYIILSPSKPKPKRRWLILLVLLLLLVAGLGLWFLLAKPFNSDRPADQTTTYQNPGPEEIYLTTSENLVSPQHTHVLSINNTLSQLDQNLRLESDYKIEVIPSSCSNLSINNLSVDFDSCKLALKNSIEFSPELFVKLYYDLPNLFPQIENFSETSVFSKVFKSKNRTFITVVSGTDTGFKTTLFEDRGEGFIRNLELENLRIHNLEVGKAGSHEE